MKILFYLNNTVQYILNVYVQVAIVNTFVPKQYSTVHINVYLQVAIVNTVLPKQYSTVHILNVYLQVAIVNTVVPAADIIGPTLAGLIADKIGNFR